MSKVTPGSSNVGWSSNPSSSRATPGTQAQASRQANTASHSMPGALQGLFRVRTARSKNGQDNVIREDHVGDANSRISYPSVTSCLTVTGFSNNGMHGAHIPSVDTTTEHIDKMLEHMRASECDKFLVAGAVGPFKENVISEDFNTRYKISSKLQKVAPKANVKFFDTSKIAMETHVYVENHGDGNYGLSILPVTPENRGTDETVLANANAAEPVPNTELIERNSRFKF